MALRIEDYALIGDCQSAGLVGRDGSIDWLCLPRFDSGACFAALLGTPDHGRWRIAPQGSPMASSRRYRDDTLVLETVFECDSGTVAVIDFMPVPETIPNVVRIVEGRRGNVPMRLDMTIRFDYGWDIPWVQKHNGGIRAIAGPDSLTLHSPVQTHGENKTTVAEFTVSKGDRVPFVLSWESSFGDSAQSIDPEVELQETEKWWREWATHCRYTGKWRSEVLRSLITLKALTYAPTGGIVAAPTTSLPEHLGGVRNWDYRFCWLRDATLTLYSLLNAGYTEEARAWQQWLLRAVAGCPDRTQIMYGIAGERRLTELELNWLPGYEQSSPVRIGNAAHDQFQLDVYGEVFNAFYHARQEGLQAAEEGWNLEQELARFVMDAWQRPDEGIWEVRGPRKHFTHSKVMAWVAMDRAIRSVERFGLKGPVDEWRKTRQAIHEQVCQEGFHTGRNTFVQSYGSTLLDASLLMIPLVGFLDANDPRMVGTVAAIERELLHDKFVARYDTYSTEDGLPAGEGAFLPCTFWLADNYALQNRRSEALEIFQRMLGLCNDVGLLSEEYDYNAKRLIGNFPQAFSHIGLINTALRLSDHTQPAKDAT